MLAEILYQQLIIERLSSAAETWNLVGNREDGGLKVKGATGRFGRVFGGHSDTVGPIPSVAPRYSLHK